MSLRRLTQYVVYMNAAGQAVNPVTGRTIDPADPYWHIELEAAP